MLKEKYREYYKHKTETKGILQPYPILLTFILEMLTGKQPYHTIKPKEQILNYT